MPLIPPNRITAFPLKDDLQWYDPDVIFQPFDDIFGRGVVGSGDLMVVANGAGDGQISVQAGRGYVPYTSGGKRMFRTSVSIRSDAAEFLNAIPAWPGSGNPKVHRVIARIRDATLTPADQVKGGVFDVLPGTATSGANLTNLSGAQAVPADALLLGNVLQNGSTIPGGNIDSTFGTVRARARIGAGNSPTKAIQVNGAALTDRGATNFIAGTGITIAGADDAANDRSNVTITNSQPAPVIPWVELFDYTVAGSAKASIGTFEDGGSVLLPQTYSTLVVRGRIQSNAAQADTVLNVTFNNDASNNYDNNFNGIDATSAGTFVGVNTQGASQFTPMRFNAASISSGWGMFRMEIFNYASTSPRMGVLFDGVDSGATSDVRRWVGSGNYHGSAISRIYFYQGTGSFVIGSRIQVYGIL